MTDVRNRITLARKLSGLSKKELGAASGVPAATVRRLEQGGRTPSPATLCRIADALDVPVLFLLPMIVDVTHGANAEEFAAIEALIASTENRLRARKQARDEHSMRIAAIRTRARAGL